MFILIQIKASIVAFFLGFYLLLICLVAIPFRLKKRLALVAPHWQFAAKFAIRHAAHAVIDVAEDRRTVESKSQSERGLFIANHQSFFDIPMIVTMIQVPPIMKKEVLYVPFVGLLGWICGAVPFSRSNMASKRKVLDLVKKRILTQKMSVQVYPEGTRSKTGIPAPYEKTARALIILAYKEKIPVTPVSMYGTRGIFNSIGLVNAGKHLGIIIHSEQHPEKFESADLFAKACWDLVVRGHEELTERIAPPNKS